MLAGEGWLHEIKHDGYRLIVRKTGASVRVYTRRGYDWTERFPLIVEGNKRLARLRFYVNAGRQASSAGSAPSSRSALRTGLVTSRTGLRHAKRPLDGHVNNNRGSCIGAPGSGHARLGRRAPSGPDLPTFAFSYLTFAGAPGSTAPTPSGLMLKAKNVNGSLPGFPHWCTSPNGS